MPRLPAGSDILFYFDNGLGNFLLLAPIFKILNKNGYSINIALDRFGERVNLLHEFCLNFKYINNIEFLPEDITKVYYKYENIIITRCPYKDFLNDLWKKALMNQNRIKWNMDKKHEYQFNLDTILVPLDIIDIPDTYLSIVDFTYEWGKVVKDIKHKSVVLCNSSNSGEIWEKKKFRMKFAVDLVSKFISEDYDIYYVGGYNDKSFGKELSSCVNNSKQFYNMAGKINIMDSIDILIKSLGLVTTDTAMMHIANLLGKPLVTLFGPTLTSKTGPMNNNSITKVVKSNIYCSPCFGKINWFKCDDNICMDYFNNMGTNIFNMLEIMIAVYEKNESKCL